MIADGVERVVVSHQRSDMAIMRQAGVSLSPGDRVVHGADGDGESALAVQRAVPVVADVDGRVFHWHTRAGTVEAALAEIGARVEEGDDVSLNGVGVSPQDYLTGDGRLMVSRAGLFRGEDPEAAATADSPLLIRVLRAVPFTVMEDGHTLALKSTAPSVSLALAENGVEVRPGDFVYPDPDTPLVAGLSARVYHANRLDVVLPEGAVEIYTHAASVEDALARADIPLGDLDRVEPSRDAAVVDGMEVWVYRISTGTVVEREEISYRTVARPDDSLDWGQVRRVDGQAGVRALEYQVTYENGVEVSRYFSREYVEQEPVDAVVYYPGGNDYSAAGIPEEMYVVSVMHVYATWYNPASSGKPLDSPGYGMTSTGVYVTRGVVAVDPTVIPYGTKMYIPGYGIGIAADCGGAVKGNIIDLGFPDGVVPDWSSRWVDIYILGE